MVRNLVKRITALFCLVVMLVSSCLTGIVLQEPVEVKALAVVDDAAAAFFEMLVMLASLSAGASKEDVVVPREKAGITDFESASAYVESCYGASSGIGNLFDFSASNNFSKHILPKLAMIYMTSNYVVSKEWCRKLWNSRGLVDGSSALDFDSSVFSSKKTGTIIQFPNNDEDDKNDDGEENEEEKGKRIKFLPPSAIPFIYQTNAFTAIYMIAQAINRNEMKNKFIPDSDSSDFVGPSIPTELLPCDYSLSYWEANPIFSTIVDLSVNADSQTIFCIDPYRFVSKPNLGYICSVEHIYPLVYYENNEPWFCLAFDHELYPPFPINNVNPKFSLAMGSKLYKNDAWSWAVGHTSEFLPWEKGNRVNYHVGHSIAYDPAVGIDGTINRINEIIMNRNHLTEEGAAYILDSRNT